MLTFDRDRMTEQIVALPKLMRVAFAAACVQRQLASPVRKPRVGSTGDRGSVTRMLRDLWNGVERNAFDVEKLRRDFAVCEALMHKYDGQPEDVDSEIHPQIPLSLAHALRAAFSDSSHDVMLAAEGAYNTLDAYITERFALDYNAPGIQALIDSYPVMQVELSRQQVDLAELRTAAQTPSAEAAVIARIRRRAERDAASFFG
jgi:hypothetical protein